VEQPLIKTEVIRLDATVYYWEPTFGVVWSCPRKSGITLYGDKELAEQRARALADRTCEHSTCQADCNFF
jgi:hypothetical protein